MTYISELKITTDCYKMKTVSDIVDAICDPRCGDRAFCPLISQDGFDKPVCMVDQIVWHPEEDMPQDLEECLAALEENNIGWQMTVTGEAEGDIRHFSTIKATKVVA